MNNFIHHKSGSNEYKDKQTDITKLTLSSTYINRNIMVNHVSECRGVVDHTLQ